ncbi:biotin--[acetyl-CoA-carboxylase] ligase [Acaricomes phytoseiuli]|uniref:biotin--[acetyl-CoA-carboxylase] ligase n=1 Tax=Acaricomes phytoseiuli TaxID=291968 RepID=UPI000378E3DA|nr:biotin--[acetyl-CoA-carboxylase] ligase [Acaricomes phytoseiuli]MCW1250343.1 biotin--[acetyl-CoA-carboxylase] ligase [Acaricomes phytoseiuli]
MDQQCSPGVGRESFAARPVLDIAAVRSELLPPAGLIPRIEWSSHTGSSNDDLAAFAQAATSQENQESWPDLSVLTTERQSKGKGRLGRDWQAPASSALAISILLRPEGLPAEQYGWLGMLGALAVCRTLRGYGLPAGIKWPNDVLIRQGEEEQAQGARKVCGVLAQLLDPSPQTPAVVLGIGVNVLQSQEELPVAHATSLALAGAPELRRERLLIDILGHFARDYKRFTGPGTTADGRAELRREITTQLMTLGRHVRAELPGGRFNHGVAVGLDTTGALLIQDAQGSSTVVSAADVIHLRPAAARASVSVDDYA